MTRPTKSRGRARVFSRLCHHAIRRAICAMRSSPGLGARRVAAYCSTSEPSQILPLERVASGAGKSGLEAQSRTKLDGWTPTERAASRVAISRCASDSRVPSSRLMAETSPESVSIDHPYFGSRRLQRALFMEEMITLLSCAFKRGPGVYPFYRPPLTGRNHVDNQRDDRSELSSAALSMAFGYAVSRSVQTAAGSSSPACMRLAGISTTLDMYATCIAGSGESGVPRAVRAVERAPAYVHSRRRGRAPGGRERGLPVCGVTCRPLSGAVAPTPARARTGRGARSAGPPARPGDVDRSRSAST